MCILSRSFGLDFDPMTLIVDLDLDILKMYLRIRRHICRSTHAKVIAQKGQTDKHTHTDATENIVIPRSRMVIAVIDQ